jgi:hypothetical protein
MKIANYAHLGGLLCGISIANIFFVRKKKIIYLIILLSLILFPILALNIYER